MQAIQPDVRVLYMSGYAQPVLASEGTLGAGVSLLEKPFSEMMLLDKVREAQDFKASSVPMLIHALKQGESLFSAEEKRRVVAARQA